MAYDYTDDGITQFDKYYEIAKNKVRLKLWTLDFAKGYLSCLVNELNNYQDDEYNNYATKINDLI